MSKLIRYADVELRSSQDDENIVEGMPIIFNQRTDLGWFTEEIDAHALDGADMSDVVLNLNHDNNIVLARTTNGSLVLDLRNDGVYQSAKIVKTSQGKDIYQLVKEGLINKMSFAFTIDEDGEEWKQEANGREHRVIKKIKRLFDVSLVTFPAYDQTSAYARSKDDLADNHKALMERRANQDKKMEELLSGKNLI